MGEGLMSCYTASVFQGDSVIANLRGPSPHLPVASSVHQGP